MLGQNLLKEGSIGGNMSELLFAVPPTESDAQLNGKCF